MTYQRDFGRASGGPPTLGGGAGRDRTSETPQPAWSPAFLVAGLCAMAITAVTVPFHLLGWIPFLGDLLRTGGAAATMAALIFAVMLWVVLFALVRGLYVAGERDAVRQERLSDVTPSAETLLGYRLALLRRLPRGAPDRDSVLAARSELDHAHSDNTYGPARALVWAMPALGFLGTAAEMSTAVSGLGRSVGKAQDYAALKNALVSEVVPHLAQAFGATLLALGASVICHLLLTWTSAREQRLLLEVEEATLRHAAANPVVPVPATPGTMPFNGELGRLAEEIEHAEGALRTFATGLTALDAADLRGQLQSLNDRLVLIHATLDQPLVMTRGPGS